MSNRQKKAIIYLYKVRKVPIVELAYSFGVSRETIRKIIKEYESRFSLSGIREDIKTYNILGKRYYQLNLE